MRTRLKEMLSDNSQLMKKEDIVRLIGPDEDTFAELFNMTFSRDMPLCWRSAWILDYLSEMYDWLAVNYIVKAWNEIPYQHPDGVTRSVLRMLARYDIPEQHQGVAAELCMDWLRMESVPVAIKVWSMEIVKKISLIYPELSNEFIMVLKEQAPKNTVAFEARSRKIIKEILKGDAETSSA